MNEVMIGACEEMLSLVLNEVPTKVLSSTQALWGIPSGDHNPAPGYHVELPSHEAVLSRSPAAEEVCQH